MNEDLVMRLPRAVQEQYLIREEILKGDYGEPGAPFLTTRALAQRRGVSVVTAQHIMVGLRQEGLIELRGKKYVLAHEELVLEQQVYRKIIGILVPDIHNEFHAAMAKAVKTLAEERGYRAIIMDTGYSCAQEADAVQALVHFGVAGIISTPADVQQDPQLYRSCPVPCVLIAHAVEGSQCSSVQVSSFQVTQKIARHLVEQGYRHFAYLGTQAMRLVQDDRFSGFSTGLKCEGYELFGRDVLQLPQDMQTAELLLYPLLEQAREPLAVFCYHDLIAAALCRVCHRLGKRIPEDVGIVGFDDLPIATSVFPSLTTVRYRITSMAEIALQQLMREIRGQTAEHDNYYVEPTLIKRESTALAQQLMRQET